MSPTWPPAGVHPVPIATLLRDARAEAARPGSRVSNRWKESLEQLASLRQSLVRLSATGSYSPAAYIKARGFVVLAHSVLEDYLEGMSLEVVDGAIKRWDADDRARTALVALLRYTSNSKVPEKFDGGPWGIRTAVKASRREFRGWVEQNNGIKEKDILRLLLPTGLKESDMGTSWLADMSELGSLRGRVAHKGMPPGATHPVDPKDATDTVEKVLPTLCRIDSKLIALRDE